MITTFDSLYAGHVDMDNVGYGGIAVNDRTYSDEYLATAFDKGVAIAQTLDKHGYDTFWMAEHHFQPEGYECIPNLLMFIVHLAHVTERLRFGCGFNIAPMWHPLRPCRGLPWPTETKGGALRVGRGLHTPRVNPGSPLRTAGQPQHLRNGGGNFKPSTSCHSPTRAALQLPPQEVPYRGYPLGGITLVPGPGPLVSVAAIQGTAGPGALWPRCFKGVIGGGSSEGGAMDGIMHGYRDALRRNGKPEAELGEDLAVGFHFHIAPTVEDAARQGARYYEENLKMFGPLRLTRGLSDQQMRDISNPEVAPNAGSPPRGRHRKRQRGWRPPDRIIELLKGVEELYPRAQRVQEVGRRRTPQSDL